MVNDAFPLQREYIVLIASVNAEIKQGKVAEFVRFLLRDGILYILCQLYDIFRV